MTYANPQLFINGQWCDAADGKTIPVFNPATGLEIGRLAHASVADLDRALEAAQKGFDVWRNTPAVERSKILRKAANILRERTDAIASLMTQENGKPLAEAKGEIGMAVEVTEWFSEESRRVYGRIVPSRNLAN